MEPVKAPQSNSSMMSSDPCNTNLEFCVCGHSVGSVRSKRELNMASFGPQHGMKMHYTAVGLVPSQESA
jgi:hypothetical protein